MLFGAGENSLKTLETHDKDESDPSSTLRITPEIKLHGLLRELNWKSEPLPSRSGRELPIDQMTEDEIFAELDLIAIASMCRERAAELKSTDCKALLVEAARKLGMRPIRTHAACLKDLELFLKSSLNRVETKAPKAVGRKTLVRVLEQFRITMAFDSATRLDSTFGNPLLFPKLAASFVCLMTKDMEFLAATRKRRHFEKVMDELAQHATVLIDRQGLSDSFCSALNELMFRRKMKLHSLAASSGLDYSRLRRWLNGSQPRKDMLKDVNFVEDALQVSRGTLAGLVEVPATRFPRDDVLTDDVREMLEHASLPMSYLPEDWVLLNNEKKQEALNWTIKHVVFGSPYRRYLRSLDDMPIDHAGLPKQMTAEFNALALFKSRDDPDPYHAREFTEPYGRRQRTHGGRWSLETTIPLFENWIRRFLTFLKEIDPDCSDKIGACGFGIFIHAGLLKALTNMIAERRFALLQAANAFVDMGCDPPSSGKIFTISDYNRLIVISGLFSPKTGYFYHHRPKFMAVKGYIDEAWIAAAEQDWPATIAKERKAIDNLVSNIESAARAVRDPWYPIEPILARDDPLTPVIVALDRMEKDRPSYLGSPTYAARHDRDHLLMSIAVHTRLRRKHYGELTYKKDNTGHLRRSSQGTWVIVIPQQELKNTGSTALPANGAALEIELDPEDDALYGSIDRWLTGPGCSRHILHGDDCGDWLFPGDKGQQISGQMTSQICYAFSARYLAECPWRAETIKGVLPFGMHSLRDIAATHLLKIRGSYEDAAAALFDTEQTMRKHYARFLSVEKSRRTNKLIRNSIRRDGPTGNEPNG